MLFKICIEYPRTLLGFQYVSESPAGLFPHQPMGPLPRVSDSVGQGQGLALEILISYQVTLMVLVRDQTLRTTGLE